MSIKSAIYQKIKTEKIGKYFSHSCQHISHLSCKFVQIRKKNVTQIHQKLTILSTKIIISQKLKLWKLIFRSCQHIRIFHVNLSNLEEKKCYSKFIENWQILSTKTAISRKNLKFNFSSIQHSVKNPNWIISHGTPDESHGTQFEEHWCIACIN